MTKEMNGTLKRRPPQSLDLARHEETPIRQWRPTPDPVLLAHHRLNFANERFDREKTNEQDSTARLGIPLFGTFLPRLAPQLRIVRSVGSAIASWEIIYGSSILRYTHTHTRERGGEGGGRTKAKCHMPKTKRTNAQT